MEFEDALSFDRLISRTLSNKVASVPEKLSFSEHVRNRYVPQLKLWVLRFLNIKKHNKIS